MTKSQLNHLNSNMFHIGITWCLFQYTEDVLVTQRRNVCEYAVHTEYASNCITSQPNPLQRG